MDLVALEFILEVMIVCLDLVWRFMLEKMNSSFFVDIYSSYEIIQLNVLVPDMVLVLVLFSNTKACLWHLYQVAWLLNSDANVFTPPTLPF